MKDDRILLIQDLLIKHEVEQFFLSIPLECFHGDTVENMVEVATNSITSSVFEIIGALPNYDKITSRTNVKIEVEKLVKIEIMNFMIDMEYTFKE